MSRGKAGVVVLIVTLLALAVMGGFFLGRNTLAGPVRIITQTAAQTARQPDVTEDDGQPRTAADTPGESQTQKEAPSSGAPAEEAKAQDSFPININTATVEELQALPGIGESRAKAIVAYREEHGCFTYVEDLQAVRGIGEGILEKIMDYITVGEQGNG